MKCLSCTKVISGLNIFGRNHCWECYIDPVKLNPEVIACDCSEWCSKCKGERYYTSGKCEECDGTGIIEAWDYDDDWWEGDPEMVDCYNCNNGYLYKPWYGDYIGVVKEDLKEYWTK